MAKSKYKTIIKEKHENIIDRFLDYFADSDPRKEINFFKDPRGIGAEPKYRIEKSVLRRSGQYVWENYDSGLQDRNDS
jgi:hypothetical protein